MSIQQLEITIRLNGHEWTITTEDCIRERLWFALAKHFETNEGADKEFRRLFNSLSQIQQSVDFTRRHEESAIELSHLQYIAGEFAEEVKKP